MNVILNHIFSVCSFQLFCQSKMKASERATIKNDFKVRNKNTVSLKGNNTIH